MRFSRYSVKRQTGNDEQPSRRHCPLRVRFVSEDQPGWVECEFVDSAGVRHTLRDKVPVFTADDLWSTSVYPQRGVAACEILERRTDHEGREVVRISTRKPYGIESTEGITDFTVFPSQLAAVDRQAV